MTNRQYCVRSMWPTDSNNINKNKNISSFVLVVLVYMVFVLLCQHSPHHRQAVSYVTVIVINIIKLLLKLKNLIWEFFWKIHILAAD